MTKHNLTKEIRIGANMITDIANQLAAEAGIRLTSVTFNSGVEASCRDVHIFHISADGKTVNVIINQGEVSEYSGVAGTVLTVGKVRGAIDRLKVMVEG